jgi:hypothetical protein
MTAARRINCTGASRLARDRWNRSRNTMAIFFGHRRCKTVATGFARMNWSSCRDRAIDRDLHPVVTVMLVAYAARRE